MIERFIQWAGGECDGELNFWKVNTSVDFSQMNDQIAFGVENSLLVVAFASDAFFDSDSCARQIKYAYQLRKKVVFVNMHTNLNVANSNANSKHNVRISIPTVLTKV